MPRLFAGATQETPSVDEKLTKKCPVHNWTSHALEQFKELPERNSFMNINFACLFCCSAMAKQMQC